MQTYGFVINVNSMPITKRSKLLNINVSCVHNFMPLIEYQILSSDKLSLFRLIFSKFKTKDKFGLCYSLML